MGMIPIGSLNTQLQMKERNEWTSEQKEALYNAMRAQQEHTPLSTIGFETYKIGEHIPYVKEEAPPSKKERSQAEIMMEMQRMQLEAITKNIGMYRGTLITKQEAEAEVKKAPPKKNEKTAEFREAMKIKWWLHALGAILVAVLADGGIQIGKYIVSVRETKVAPVVQVEEPEKIANVEIVPVTNFTGIRYILTTNYSSTTTNTVSGTFYYK